MDDIEENAFPEITIFKTKTNTYLIECGNIRGNYLFNNIPVNIDYNTKDFELAEEPKTIVKIVKSTHLSHYENYKNEKQKLTLEEYQLNLDILTTTGELNDNDEYIFSDLDEEFAYRKFRKSWIPKYETKISQYNIPFQIKNITYSEYSDIVPLYQIGNYEISDPTCVYRNKLRNHLKEICKEMNIVFLNDEEKSVAPLIVTCSTHTGIHYAKLNNNYIFTNESLYKQDEISFRGTYSECVAKRNEITNGIKTILTEKIDLLTNTKISNRKIVVDGLENILDLVGKLQVMVKSTSLKRTLQNKILDLKSKI